MADTKRIFYRARQTFLEMFKDRGYTVPDRLKQITEGEFEILFEAHSNKNPTLDIEGVTDADNNMVYVKFITGKFDSVDDKLELMRAVKLYQDKELSSIKHLISTLNQVNDASELKVYHAQEALLEKCLSDINSLDVFKSGSGGGGIAGKFIDFVHFLADAKFRLIVAHNTFNCPLRSLNQTKDKCGEEFIGEPYVEIYQVHKVVNPKCNKFQPNWRLIKDPVEIKKIYERYDAKPLLFGSICIDDPVNRYYGGRPSEGGQLAQIYEVTRSGVSVFYRKVVLKRMNIKKTKTEKQ
jgi:hypothetical protein